MSEDTRLEVIKALAYGVNIRDIANMAEVDESEIEEIRDARVEEVAKRQQEMEGKTGNDD